MVACGGRGVRSVGGRRARVQRRLGEHPDVHRSELRVHRVVLRVRRRRELQRPVLRRRHRVQRFVHGRDGVHGRVQRLVHGGVLLRRHVRHDVRRELQVRLLELEGVHRDRGQRLEHQLHELGLVQRDLHRELRRQLHERRQLQRELRRRGHRPDDVRRLQNLRRHEAGRLLTQRPRETNELRRDARK
jgi:hypothetical protein